MISRIDIVEMPMVCDNLSPILFIQHIDDMMAPEDFIAVDAPVASTPSVLISTPGRQHDCASLLIPQL